jgi:hypothetical protein
MALKHEEREDAKTQRGEMQNDQLAISQAKWSGLGAQASRLLPD